MGKSIKETMQEFTVNQALKYLEGNPEENIPKLMAFVNRMMPKDWYAGQRNAIRNAIDQKNNWYQLILRLYDLDRACADILPELYHQCQSEGERGAGRDGGKIQLQHPWAILLDPTTACNLNCTGCWAAEYGHQFNLSLEDIDSIVKQEKNWAPTCISIQEASRRCNKRYFQDL